MPKQKTFRFKRTAKRYQAAHGGRIVGSTGSYRVVKAKKNPSRSRTRAQAEYRKGRSAARRESRGLSDERMLLPKRRKSMANLPTLDPMGGWIKAKAVKVIKSGGKVTRLLIKQ